MGWEIEEREKKFSNKSTQSRIDNDHDDNYAESDRTVVDYCVVKMCKKCGDSFSCFDRFMAYFL